MTKDGFFQELKDRRYFIPNPIKRLEAKRRGKREWARKQKELEKNF